jgi:segregation and condensation protein B
LDTREMKGIIETLLFVSEKPLTIERVVEVINKAVGRDVIRSLFNELIMEYRGCALQIREVAEGYQLCTRSEYSEWIKDFLKIERRSKLSRASLETLAIIAYKQPITRMEVEDIRKVEISGILKGLLEKRLIRIMGRKKVLGRPMMYGTTREFLEYFGLKELSDLPQREEFLSMYDKGSAKKEEEKEAELFDNNSH